MWKKNIPEFEVSKNNQKFPIFTERNTILTIY